MEESNTANILLCLSTTNQNNSPKSLEDSRNQLPKAGIQSGILTKGNIVDHLRHKVRVEAAAKYHPISPLASPATGLKRRLSISKQDDLHSTSSRGSAHTEHTHDHDHDDSKSTNSIEESIEMNDSEHPLDHDTVK